MIPASIPFTFGDEVMNVPVVGISSVPPAERVIAPKFTVLEALADTAAPPESCVLAKACVKASLRLTASRPLPKASTLEELTEPVVLPEPIASVPKFTVVVPV